MPFLPISKSALAKLGIETPDFIVVSADAYVDHPSFGHALIARLIEAEGFSVAVLPQPVLDADFTSLGAPRHAFLISAGVVDSMVNNYTAALTKRKDDAYSNLGKAGRRPDRVTEVYSKALKRLYPDTPVIAGGIEPSLRRLSHYDYWSDSVRRSICFDAPVDLMIYGMGENPIIEICACARKNIPLSKVKDIKGTAYLTTLASASKAVKKAISEGGSEKYTIISSHERVSTDKKLYAKAFIQAQESNGKGIIQKQDNEHFTVVNPPAAPVTQAVLDRVYSLSFMRAPHPSYTSVPAIEEVKFSVTAHRGCYGNCSFCALTYHQGKQIARRSADSIMQEIQGLTQLDGFKGYIHDIGGPTANFYGAPCAKSQTDGACRDKDCIGYTPCKNLTASHKHYADLLHRAKSIKGVKKVFVRSGVRFDYVNLDPDKTFINQLAAHHVSGQLKVAPEHVSDNVLRLMNKPPFSAYLKFSDEFYKASHKAGKEQYLVPYFVSSHPGCTLADAAKLTEYLMDIRYMPLQVQDFYPTPATLSTTMYYTQTDPRTGEQLYVAKTKQEKAMQRALLQYRLPKNRALVIQALTLAGREDLIAKLRQQLY
ncbi:MAG: YgiQ family radical SAM protein [Firmicutes bacterium]|nr:YgiQ family radical SAM protein [Bacillota bacterium]